MTGRLSGKVVLVDGASRGQGAAEVRALTAQGATVIATDLTTAPEEDSAPLITGVWTSPTPPTGRQ